MTRVINLPTFFAADSFGLAYGCYFHAIQLFLKVKSSQSTSPYRKRSLT